MQQIWTILQHDGPDHLVCAGGGQHLRPDRSLAALKGAAGWLPKTDAFAGGALQLITVHTANIDWPQAWWP